MDRPHLPQTRAILAGDDDEFSALRHHLTLVTAERDRLDRISDTIVRTLAELEGRDRVPDEEFFRGLNEGRAQLAATLQERFDEAAAGTVRTSAARTAHWTRSEHEQAAAEGRDLYARMSRMRQRGVDPASPHALDVVAEHHGAVRAMWPVDHAAYHALADLIETDPQQRDAVAVGYPDLPSWLAAAIRTYAVEGLDYRPEAAVEPSQHGETPGVRQLAASPSASSATGFPTTSTVRMRPPSR